MKKITFSLLLFIILFFISAQDKVVFFLTIEYSLFIAAVYCDEQIY